MFDKSLYSVVNATRALIGRCPWSIGVLVCEDLRIARVKNLKNAQQLNQIPFYTAIKTTPAWYEQKRPRTGTTCLHTSSIVPRLEGLAT